MTDPPSLWADRAARESRRGWFARPQEPEAAAPPQDPPPPRRDRVRLALGAALGLALLAVAVLAGMALGRDDGRPAAVKPAARTAGGFPAGRLAGLSKALAPSVVQVRTSTGSATGFVIREAGTILTTARVVARAKRLRVVFDDPVHPLPATLLASDPASGLAALSISPAAAPQLRPLPLADSDKLRIGDPVLALSYPRGLSRSSIPGIVAATGRRLVTDADAVPGAPIADATGRVAGMAIEVPGPHAGTVAVSSQVIAQVLPRLEAAQPAVPQATAPAAPASGAYLGVRSSTPPAGSGALLVDVERDGPADRAGLQGASSTGPGGGDVILGLAQTRIRTPQDLSDAVAAHRPGEVVTLLVERAGQRFNVDVTLETRPPGGP